MTASPPPSHAPRTWLVSAAGLVLLFAVLAVQKIWGADTWWQLRTGQWILEHGIPRTDHLSYTVPANDWLEMRWLFCVALELGWRAGGPALLIAGQAAALAAVWLMILWPVRGVLRSPAGAALLTLALCAGWGRWVLRPELVTYVLMAAFLVTLEHASHRRRARSVWTLPFLQVVWTNAHTLFVMGPILAWTFAGAAVVKDFIPRLAPRPAEPPDPAHTQRSTAIRLVIVALLVTAACWVNPYFHKGAMFPIVLWSEIQSGHVVSEMIGEMRSPLEMPLATWTWDLVAGALLAAAGLATFIWNRRRLDLARLVIFVAGVYLATKAQRNIGLMTVMVGWAALRNAHEAMQPRPEGAPARFAWPLHGALGAFLLFASWYVVTDRVSIEVGAPKEFGVGVVEWNTPAGAARFLEESGAPRPVYNLIRDGGYLAWRGVPVHIDGRMEVYGEAFLSEFFARRAADWPAIAARWNIQTAILAVSGSEDFVKVLHASPDWALVYLDHRDVIFVRRAAEHAALIARYEIDAARPWAAAPPDERPEPWKSAIGGPGRPWHSLGTAETFLALGAIDNAALQLEHGLRTFPRHPRMTAMFAALLRFRNRHDDADTVLSHFGPRSSWRVFAERTAARLLMDAGRHADAIAPLERAVRVDPDDETLRLVLADLFFQAGNFRPAAETYERLVAANKAGAPEWLKLAFARERLGDGPGAVAAYRESLALDPSQHAVHNQLGLLLASRNDFAGARASFEQALRIKPDYAAAQKNLDAIRSRR